MLVTGSESVAVESEQGYQIGEKWVYQHEGPKIERWELSWDFDPFKGERTKEVMTVEKSNGKKYWVIKESFGAKDPVQTLHYVDERNLVVKHITLMVQMSGMRVISLNKPAYPFDYVSLKIGEEKEFQSQRTVKSFYSTYPIAIKFKRLEDQTVEVPAGKFINCQHLKVSISYTIPWNEDRDLGQCIISRDSDLWYHAQANGVVKEVTHSESFEYMGEIRPGYTITSVLKSYSK
jgi:hypothetical protein